jgi:hypothetical protein
MTNEELMPQVYEDDSKLDEFYERHIGGPAPEEKEMFALNDLEAALEEAEKNGIKPCAMFVSPARFKAFENIGGLVTERPMYNGVIVRPGGEVRDDSISILCSKSSGGWFYWTRDEEQPGEEAPEEVTVPSNDEFRAAATRAVARLEQSVVTIVQHQAATWDRRSLDATETTHSAILQFKDGSTAEIPEPDVGEGWFETDEEKDLWEEGVIDEMWDIGDITHEPGLLAWNEYEIRISEEYAKLLSWKEWQREKPIPYIAVEYYPNPELRKTPEYKHADEFPTKRPRRVI